MNMTVKRAIGILEDLGGSKLIRKYKHFNCDTNRHETAYVFRYLDAANTWTATSIGDLRAEARKVERLWAS